MTSPLADRLWKDHGQPFVYKKMQFQIRSKFISSGHVAYGFKWNFGHTIRLFDCPQRSELNNRAVAEIAARAWIDGHGYDPKKETKHGV